MKDVPEPSERWTTAMAVDGSLASGLSFVIAAIVPLGDLAMEDVGEGLPVEDDFARLDARC